MSYLVVSSFFFTNHGTPDIYTYVHTLPLHDALPISDRTREGRKARELGVGAHRFLDPQHLVPLRHAFGAREAADLELARVPAGREVRDGDILALARTRRADRAPAPPHRRVERRLRFGDDAALVALNHRRNSEHHTIAPQ